MSRAALGTYLGGRYPLKPDTRPAVWIAAQPGREVGGYIDGKYSPGVVAIIDLASRRVVKRIATKARPWAMAIRPDDSALYVTRYLHIDHKGWVSQIDPSVGTVRREFALREDTIGGGQAGVVNVLGGLALRQERLGLRDLRAVCNWQWRTAASRGRIPLDNEPSCGNGLAERDRPWQGSGHWCYLWRVSWRRSGHRASRFANC